MGERTGEDPLRSRAPHPPHTSHDDQCNRRHSSHVSQYAYDRVRAESTKRDRSVARPQRSRTRTASADVPYSTRGLQIYLLKRLKRVIASRRSVITLSATHVGIGRQVRDATSDTYYIRVDCRTGDVRLRGRWHWVGSGVSDGLARGSEVHRRGSPVAGILSVLFHRVEAGSR